MVFANCLRKFAKEKSKNPERDKLVSKPINQPEKHPGFEGKKNRLGKKNNKLMKGEMCAKKQ